MTVRPAPLPCLELEPSAGRVGNPGDRQNRQLPQACSERRQTRRALELPSIDRERARPATRRLSRATEQIRSTAARAASHHTRDSGRESLSRGRVTQSGPIATAVRRRPSSAERARRSRKQISAHRWHRPRNDFVFDPPGRDGSAIGAPRAAAAPGAMDRLRPQLRH